MTLSDMLRGPNLFTVGNAACGLIAILLLAGSVVPAAAVSMPTFAASLLFLAFLFDVSDGAVARRAGSSGPYGAILDSLADMVSFGIAPSLLIAVRANVISLPNVFRPVIFLASVLFALAAMLRLARYTYDTLASSAAPYASLRVFIGLPAPAAAMMIAAAVLTSDGPSGILSVDVAWLGQWALLLLALVLPILMVGTLRFPDLPKFYLKRRLPAWHLIALAFFGILAGVGPALLLLTFCYLMFGPKIAKIAGA